MASTGSVVEWRRLFNGCRAFRRARMLTVNIDLFNLKIFAILGLIIFTTIAIIKNAKTFHFSFQTWTWPFFAQCDLVRLDLVSVMHFGSWKMSMVSFVSTCMHHLLVDRVMFVSVVFEFKRVFSACQADCCGCQVFTISLVSSRRLISSSQTLHPQFFPSHSR